MLALLSAGCDGRLDHTPTVRAQAPLVDDPLADTGELSAKVCENRRGGYAGPVQLSEVDDARRVGTGVTKLAQITTSAHRPIQVCGEDRSHAWLLRATCADGSHPFASHAGARRAAGQPGLTITSTTKR